MHAVEVNQADFEEQVVKASFKQPVVIDFWAPWCGPCKVLKPLLEKLADEFGGKFVLAKVNSDENPEVSAHFSVRGIPAVKAMVNGNVVDEFTGAQPESFVREWLGKIIPSPAEELRLAAQQDKAAGNVPGALHKLAQASALDPKHEGVRVDAAELMLMQGELDEAMRLLESVKSPEMLKDARVMQLHATPARLHQAHTQRPAQQDSTGRREGVGTHVAPIFWALQVERHSHGGGAFVSVA